MRLAVLTALTMVAFAANSVLNRMALAEAGMGPAGFALVRLVSGAAVLCALCLWRGGRLRPGVGAVKGAAMLSLYMLGFSFAYLQLDAGLGALILFGGVQVTMFAGAVIGREPVPAQRWAGAVLALAGLGWLLWPAGASAPPVLPALSMAAAALGWGIYSLMGRGAQDPLSATALAFALAAPAGAAAFALHPDALPVRGVALAMLSGAVTSGLGYALWYALVPQLGATRAAVAQLTVPIIALAGGMAFLGESLTARFFIAALLVLGGVSLSLWRRNKIF